MKIQFLKTLFVCMCLTCLSIYPASALTEESFTKNDSEIKSMEIMAREHKETKDKDANELSLVGAIPYTIEVGGTAVTDTNYADVLGDGTVSYDEITNTLTLNSASIQVTSGNYGLRILNEGQSPLIILLNGTSQIDCSGLYGIYATGSVVFNGSGSLDCYGSDYGMLIKGDVTIEENVDITSKCGDIISGSSYGLRGNGAFVIKDNAKVYAEAGYAPERSCGLYAYTTLEIGGNSNVTAKGGKGDNDSYGIRTTNMTISGGAVSATGGQGYYGGSGIYTQTLDITGGSTTLQGGTTLSGPSYGLMAAKTFTISSGELFAYGGTGTDASYGIHAGDGMEITGGKVEAESGDGEYTYGIETNQLTMSNGTLKSSAKDADTYSWGINCSNEFNFSGGSIDTKGGNAKNYSYGLQSTAVINITGGTIKAQSATAKNSHGIWAFEKVNIKDADLEITSMGNPITTPYGETNIFCDDIQISKATGSSAINATISSSKNSSDNYNVYSVYVHDAKTSFLVPEGKSVNEMYCSLYQVDDIAKAMSIANDGYVFDGFYTDENFTSGNEYNFNMQVTRSTSVYHKWLKLGNVTTEVSEGGSIEVSDTLVPEGSKVTITVNPQNGYVLETLLVIDTNDNSIEVTKESDNTYSYIQPADDTVVKATFKAVTTPTEKDDTTTNTGTDSESNATTSPKTGDSSKMLLWTSSLILSATSVFMILVDKKKKSNR